MDGINWTEPSRDYTVELTRPDEKKTVKLDETILSRFVKIIP
jgi:hypothetical protein